MTDGSNQRAHWMISLVIGLDNILDVFHPKRKCWRKDATVSRQTGVSCCYGEAAWCSFLALQSRTFWSCDNVLLKEFIYFASNDLCRWVHFLWGRRVQPSRASCCNLTKGCNTASQRTHPSSALLKTFHWGVLLSLVNELFTDWLRKICKGKKWSFLRKLLKNSQRIQPGSIC